MFGIPTWIMHPFGALGSKTLGWDQGELHQDGKNPESLQIQEILDLNSHCVFQESTQGIPDSLWHSWILVEKVLGATFP